MNYEMKRLRIMHLTGSMRVGGAEKAISTLLQNSSDLNNHYYLRLLTGGMLKQNLQHQNVDIQIQPFSWLWLPWWIFCMVRDLKSLKIDVLHTHLFTTDILGRLAGRIADVPLVVSTLHAPSTWKKSSRMKNRIKCIADRISADYGADALIAISPEILQYQSSIGGLPKKKMYLIGNPVDTKTFSPNLFIRKQMRRKLGIQDTGVFMVSVGSLKPIKGHRHLLEAAAILSRRYSRIHFAIAGDGPLRNELQEKIKQNGIEHCITLLGNVKDVRELLCAADIFVLPSLSEGVSIALLEAMSMKLAIVATAVGGNVDLITEGKNGRLVPAQNSDKLAGTIAVLIENPSLRLEYGEKARQHVMLHYDAKIISQKTDQLYRRLLSDKQKARKQATHVR